MEDIVVPPWDKILLLVTVSGLSATAMTEFFKRTGFLGLVALYNKYVAKKEATHKPAWFSASKRVLPIVFGSLLGFWAAKEGLVSSNLMGLMCGSSVGLFSTAVYKKVQAYLDSFQVPLAPAANAEPVPSEGTEPQPSGQNQE